MSSSLVRGKHIICRITGLNSADVISDGALFQRNGEIIEVGRYDDLRVRHPAEEVIGSLNHVVMPGLINSHFHVGITPFQLGAPDLPLELWIPTLMGTRHVDPYLNHLYGATQMITSGTTTVKVLAWERTPIDLKTSEKILKAYEESGMRVSYGPIISTQNFLVAGAGGGEEDFASLLPIDLARRFRSLAKQQYFSTEEHVSILHQLCVKYADTYHRRIRIVAVPSQVYRCSDDLLVALKELALRHNISIDIHLQETVYQKLYGLRIWGKTPLQHLYDLGFLGPEVTCSHSLWLTDEDIEVMAETGANVCHLASSNLRLQSGIAPVNRLVERGIRVALGTDEAGINDDKDMLQEMRVVLKLHRVPGIENTPLTAHQVFQMATVNGAYDTSFGELIGTLEPGKRADMVLMNLQNIEEPYLDPDVSIVDAVIHRGRSTDVDTVIVDGEVVLRDHQLTRVDGEILSKELRRSLTQPLPPYETEWRELGRQLEPHLRRFYAGAVGKLEPPHYYYNARS